MNTRFRAIRKVLIALFGFFVFIWIVAFVQAIRLDWRYNEYYSNSLHLCRALPISEGETFETILTVSLFDRWGIQTPPELAAERDSLIDNHTIVEGTPSQRAFLAHLPGQMAEYMQHQSTTDRSYIADGAVDYVSYFRDYYLLEEFLSVSALAIAASQTFDNSAESEKALEEISGALKFLNEFCPHGYARWYPSLIQKLELAIEALETNVTLDKDTTSRLTTFIETELEPPDIRNLTRGIFLEDWTERRALRKGDWGEQWAFSSFMQRYTKFLASPVGYPIAVAEETLYVSSSFRLLKDLEQASGEQPKSYTVPYLYSNVTLPVLRYGVISHGYNLWEMEEAVTIRAWLIKTLQEKSDPVADE